MSIKYFLGEKTLTVVSGSRPRSIERDHPFFSEIVAIVTDPDADVEWLETLLDPLSPLRDAQIDGDAIEIHQTTVTRHGEALPVYLQERIVDTVRAGLPVEPWKLFVERVYSNPSFESREDLARFMDGSNLPMTPEGKFLAYKRVNADYTSCHANPDGSRLDNSVGNTVVMPGGRRAVDSNSNRTCSNGLHVCSQAYLKSYYGGQGRIVIVEVDPADVVSVPTDYQNTKARVWRYTVVGEVPLATEDEALEWGVVSLDYLNQESLDLVRENIARILDAVAVAEEAGDQWELDEQTTALANAEALRDRIEIKLEADRIAAEEAAEEAWADGYDYEDYYDSDDDEEWDEDDVDLANYEDAPLFTPGPRDLEFERLLAEEEEIERQSRQFQSAQDDSPSWGAAYEPTQRQRRKGLLGWLFR